MTLHGIRRVTSATAVALKGPAPLTAGQVAPLLALHSQVNAAAAASLSATATVATGITAS